MGSGILKEQEEKPDLALSGAMIPQNRKAAHRFLSGQKPASRLVGVGLLLRFHLADRVRTDTLFGCQDAQLEGSPVGTQYMGDH